MKDDPYFARKLTFSLPTNDGGVLRTVRDVHAYLEPIRKDWIQDEAFTASRLSMMRIMARRMKAATVVA